MNYQSNSNYNVVSSYSGNDIYSPAIKKRVRGICRGTCMTDQGCTCGRS